MKQFNAHGLFARARWLQTQADIWAEPDSSKFKASDVFSSETFEELANKHKDLLRLCEVFDLPASAESCEELFQLIKKGDTSFTKLQPLVQELAKRIQAELKAHLFLYVPRDTARFYTTPFHQWGEVVAAFPSTSYDIAEASKSLALERNTAAVFHLMRVMGAGVTALGKSLNEPTLDASHNLTWDNILSRCTKELSEKFSGKSPEWQSDKEFYAAATTKLLAVKDAWRNPNAHQVGEKYTEEEAEDIYRTVRSLMRKLSTKLKENP